MRGASGRQSRARRLRATSEKQGCRAALPSRRKIANTSRVTAVFGREQELARAYSFLEDSGEGFGVLLLEGEAGIGKTTVWRAGVERARELGFRVLEARPAAPERELSFAALGDLLAAMQDAIGSLPGPQRRALRIALVLEDAEGEPADDRVIAVAVLELLRRVASEQPLLVALDDIQWLDPPSMSALQFALRRLDKEPIRTLATSRPDADASAFGFDGAKRITVGPLPLQALDQLVSTRLGARFLRPMLRQLEEASGGNPFYALEIAAGLLRSGRRLEPGEPLPIPVSLRELVRDRLAILTPAARQAALATAALAQPTVAAVDEAVCGDPGAVSEAVAAGVLDRDGETLRFTHPLLASTLYEDSPLGERWELHRRLAGIVVAPEERARHLAEAADGPDEELSSALEAAAASLVARGARDTGARLAKQALELTPSGWRPDAHRRRLEWARYTLAAGDPHRAEALLEDHLELAKPGRERAEVALELGKARLATRGSWAARAGYERALRELEGTDEAELRTMVLIELAGTDLDEMRWDSDASQQAVALAEKVGKADLLARALGMHALMLVFLGRPPPEKYWRRALEVEKEVGELRFCGPAYADIFAAFLRGDGRTAAKRAEQVAASMRRRGDSMLPAGLLVMTAAAREHGDWDTAARCAQEAHDLVVQTGQESLEHICLLSKAELALLRGDLDASRHYVEEAMVLFERLDASSGIERRIEAQTGWVLGRIASISGRHAQAHEWLTAAIEAVQQLGRYNEGFVVELLAADSECLVALGANEEATRQLERLLEMTDALRVPMVDGYAARAQGLVAASAGDSAAAVGHLERAVESFLSASLPFELARTLFELGGVQRRARQKLAARRTLGRALETFDRLGASLWAERTRAELKKISGRPSRSGALTATEQSVADLVAAGRSNAEVAHELFLSPKTVEWNLSKIYKKLHVRSRTELAAKLQKQAPVSR